MGIEQNFNRNLKKAMKDQTPTLPSDNKFIFQQLLKNANHIEENLEDDKVGKSTGKGYYCRCADNTLCHSTDPGCYGQCCVGETVIAEYNVGNLKEVINKLKEQASYQEFNNIGIYGNAGSAYTFRSQGPIPGGYTERGYNFESDGPLGVDYFNEETELEEKVTGGGEEDCVAPDWWSAILARCMDGSKSGGGKTVGGSGCSGICVPNPDGPDGCGRGCNCVNRKCQAGSGNRSASDSSKKIKVGDLKEVIKNLREEEEKRLLKENKPCCTRWCWGRPKLGDACDGGDGNKGGRWSNDPNGCTCSYDRHDDGWDGDGKTKGRDDVRNDDVEQEMGEATTTSSSGAYSTPKFWAKKRKKYKTKNKKKKKKKSSSNKKRWMPGAKFVKVKDKCKKFPYCNQGDISALELWEKSIMRESAEKVSKKTGLPEKEVRNRVEKEIKEIIRRSFYKSPVKDLVGTGNMDTPIGKMITMSGNKPKYES